MAILANAKFPSRSGCSKGGWEVAKKNGTKRGAAARVVLRLEGVKRRGRRGVVGRGAVGVKSSQSSAVCGRGSMHVKRVRGETR